MHLHNEILGFIPFKQRVPREVPCAEEVSLRIVKAHMHDVHFTSEYACAGDPPGKGGEVGVIVRKVEVIDYEQRARGFRAARGERNGEGDFRAGRRAGSGRPDPQAEPLAGSVFYGYLYRRKGKR